MMGYEQAVTEILKLRGILAIITETIAKEDIVPLYRAVEWDGTSMQPSRQN
jgi:hypothetical protein